MYAKPRKGFWLQHVHDSVQNFVFGKGSFARSFPVLSLGSLAYIRQLAALQCVPITFPKDACAWIKDGENGIMLWTSPGKLYYIQRQHAGTSVVLFEHHSAPEHGETYVSGRLGALLRHMHLLPSGKSDEKLERLLFVWLSPRASFKRNAFGRKTMEVESMFDQQQASANPNTIWGEDLFFLKLNAENAPTSATVQLQKGTEHSNKGSASANAEKIESSFLSSEEWSHIGVLKLHVR